MEFTLAYDFSVLGNATVPQEVARAVRMPALVMAGEKTMDFMHPTADALAKLMPHAEPTSKRMTLRLAGIGIMARGEAR